MGHDLGSLGGHALQWLFGGILSLDDQLQLARRPIAQTASVGASHCVDFESSLGDLSLV